MIQITYNRAIPSVTIEGHAGSGEKGHDLVCAAVSILAYTLASLVESMKHGTQIHGATVEMNDGGARISCEPIDNYKFPIKLMFDTICAGFDILAQGYPENVSFERIDEDKGEPT